MSTQTPIRWNYTLEFIPEIAKWRVDFDARVWPPIFNKEVQEFIDLDACFAWLKTKKIEFDQGIDCYLKKLRQRTQTQLKTVLEMKN